MRICEHKIQTTYFSKCLESTQQERSEAGSKAIRKCKVKELGANRDTQPTDTYSFYFYLSHKRPTFQGASKTPKRRVASTTGSWCPIRASCSLSASWKWWNQIHPTQTRAKSKLRAVCFACFLRWYIMIPVHHDLNLDTVLVKEASTFPASCRLATHFSQTTDTAWCLAQNSLRSYLGKYYCIAVKVQGSSFDDFKLEICEWLIPMKLNAAFARAVLLLAHIPGKGTSAQHKVRY